MSGGADHLVNVWDTTTLRKLCVLDLGRGSSKEESGVDVVSCCALGRSGTVVAGSYDKSLRVWRLPLQDSVDEWTGGAFLLLFLFFLFLFVFVEFCSDQELLKLQIIFLFRIDCTYKSNSYWTYWFRPLRLFARCMCC